MGIINDFDTVLTEQMQQLQIMMYRILFSGDADEGRALSPFKGQGRVLAILTMKPEISQKELLHLLDTSKQALSKLVLKLEKSGYIVREPSEQDRRVMAIRLTEEGRRAAERMDGDTGEEVGIFDCLNEQERTDFSEYLNRIIQHCERQFPDEDFDERRRIKEEFRSSHEQGIRPCERRPDLFTGRAPYILGTRKCGQCTLCDRHGKRGKNDNLQGGAT